jgi:hypothetical protein
LPGTDVHACQHDQSGWCESYNRKLKEHAASYRGSTVTREGKTSEHSQSFNSNTNHLPKHTLIGIDS